MMVPPNLMTSILTREWRLRLPASLEGYSSAGLYTSLHYQMELLVLAGQLL